MVTLTTAEPKTEIRAPQTNPSLPIKSSKVEACKDLLLTTGLPIFLEKGYAWTRSSVLKISLDPDTNPKLYLCDATTRDLAVLLGADISHELLILLKPAKPNSLLMQTVQRLCASLKLEVPEVHVFNCRTPRTFACGRNTLVVYTGLINALTQAELEAVLLCELIRIKQQYSSWNLGGTILSRAIALVLRAKRAAFYQFMQKKWLSDEEGGERKTFENMYEEGFENPLKAIDLLGKIKNGSDTFNRQVIIAGLSILLALFADLLGLEALECTQYKQIMAADREVIKLTQDPAALHSALQKIKDRPRSGPEKIIRLICRLPIILQNLIKIVRPEIQHLYNTERAEGLIPLRIKAIEKMVNAGKAKQRGEPPIL